MVIKNKYWSEKDKRHKKIVTRELYDRVETLHRQILDSQRELNEHLHVLDQITSSIASKARIPKSAMGNSPLAQHRFIYDLYFKG